MKPIMITLDAIKAHDPCDDYDVLKSHLGDDLPLDKEFPLSLALDVEGYEYNPVSNTIWCFRAIPEHKEIIQRFAIWSARQAQHLMKDKRSIDALDIAEKFLDGKATKEELRDAAVAADSARYAAATYAAAAATYAAAAVAAVAAAAAATYAAAAYAAAAGYKQVREEQIQKLRQVLTIGEWVE